MRKIILIISILFAVAGSMAVAEMAMINAFNTGEVTDEISARADVKKYYSACRTMENFVAEPYGAAKKRPGSYYIAAVNDSEKTGRLITFELSTEESIVLEFGDETLQFYK